MRLRVMDVMPEETAELGGGDPAAFVDAWRQAHHAAQAVAEVGKSWGEAAEDDSHSAMVFDHASGAFVSEGIGVHGALAMLPPIAQVLTEDGVEQVSHEINGMTREALALWVRTQAERLGGKPRQASKPAPDLPAHVVAQGKPFAIDSPAGDVSNHYVMTQLLLERFATAVVDDAADGEHELFPRLWPHHFDLASLFVVERDSKGAMTKTIGVGITPPDAVDDAGYWYVSPWSKAEGDGFAKADLPLGRWVDRGAMPMAVLPVTEVWRIASEGELTKAGAVQAAAVAEFVAAAVNLCGAALSG